MVFVVRAASERRGDVEFMLRAHDSAVQYLLSIGSQQWGKEPFSTRAPAVEAIKALVRESQEQRQGDDLVRTFVAEAQSVPCAAASVSARFPVYVRKAGHLSEYVQASEGERDFLYLDRLISDRSAGVVARGAGKRLLEHARQLCREHGKRKLYSDCFAGPPDGLRDYYQANGFRVLGPFDVPAKHVSGVVWRGVLLLYELNEEDDGRVLDAESV